MRTTITISEQTMKAVMSFTASKTKAEAVNRALVEWVRMKKRERLMALRGKLEISGVERVRQTEIEEVESLND